MIVGHVNFGGVHTREGPVVVSILKTPISDEQEAPPSDGPKARDQRYRVLIWTKYVRPKKQPLRVL